VLRTTTNARLSTVAVMILIAASAPAMPAAAQAAPAAGPHYRLIDLGTLGGPNSAEEPEFPYINNRGTVVGFADTARPDPANNRGVAHHAFRWRRGALQDLGTLPGGLNSVANWSNDHDQVVGASETGRPDPMTGGRENVAVMWNTDGRVAKLGTLGGRQGNAVNINKSGQVTGFAANAVPDPYSIFGFGTQTRAFLWQHGRMRDLGTLGGPDAAAFYVNERGQVAGVSYTNATPQPVVDHPTRDPFLWENGKMINLGTFGGVEASVGALNNRGQVAGRSDLPGDQTAHPFLWDRGKLRDLGTLGGDYGDATWLNDAGEVTGGADTAAGKYHAYRWRSGRMTDLGTVGDLDCSVGRFINAGGEVVGTSGECGGEFSLRAFVSQHGKRMIDLNAFVPPGSNLTLTDAETINDRGEITASGLLPNGNFHAVVLTPCVPGRAPGCI
jgi:probable HAF family extracellular repeat protein